MDRPNVVICLFVCLVLNFVTVAPILCVVNSGADTRVIPLVGILAFIAVMAAGFCFGHAFVVATCWPLIRMSAKRLYVLSVVVGGISVGAYVASEGIFDMLPPHTQRAIEENFWAWLLLSPMVVSAFVSLVVVVLLPRVVALLRRVAYPPKGRCKRTGPSGDGPLSKP